MAGLALNLTSASSGNNAEVNADPVFPEHCRISCSKPGRPRSSPLFVPADKSALIASSRLAGDTAQGNGLGTLAACADRTVILTGTLLGRLRQRCLQSPVSARGSQSGRPRLRMG